MPCQNVMAQCDETGKQRDAFRQEQRKLTGFDAVSCNTQSLQLRFIEGAAWPLEPLGFEGSLAQSKSVIFP